jgi:serine protease Do
MIKPIPTGDEPRAPRSTHFIRNLMIGVSLTALVAGIGLPQIASSAQVPVATPEQTQAAALPNFTDLVSRVKPAVFAVEVKIDSNLRTSQNDNEPNGQSPFEGQQNPFKGTPFEHFFEGMPGGQFRAAPFGNNRNGPHSHMTQALGSGFFISKDGYAVTNNHVVDGATEVKIRTDDGKSYKAKVIGADPKTDLAVIKVDGNDFPFVKLAQTAPKIGEWVLAVGNPFGLGGTVTAGIVSAENRDIGSGPYDDFIQIDAPVNKGNSGGPTFNLQGEVVGVNTSIYSPSGGSVGIAFDVPSTTVSQIVPILEKNGHIDRAWLGVQIQPVTDDIAQSLGLSNDKGALVAEAQDNTPAKKAGLKAGDVIVKVNGTEIEDARDLARKIGAMAPESKADIAYIRDGKQQDVSITLDAQKSDQKQMLAGNEQGDHDLGKLGLSVAPASTVSGAGNEGMAVTSVDPDGLAASAGIETGDVILKVGGRAVSSGSDLRKALSDAAAKGRNKALTLIKHGDNQRYVVLPATTSLS